MKKIELIYKKAQKKGLPIDNLNPVTSTEIELCEIKLGYLLPESYKQFLLYQGIGGIGSTEFLGLVKDDLYLDFYLNSLTKTNQLTKSKQIPKYLFVIQIIDDEHLVCLDLKKINQNNECPVIVWSIYESFDDQMKCYPCKLADDFFNYFSSLIDEE